MYTVLFVGYATVDIIEGQWHAGGAAGVMAINASVLGVRSHLIAPLAHDVYGKWYQRHLQKTSVDYSLCPFVPHMPTCIITDPFGSGSKRQWSDRGANAHLSTLTFQPESVPSVDGIFIVNSHPDLGEKIARLSKSAVFYIPGPQAVLQKGYVREKIIARSRVIFGNEEEAAFILGKKPFSLGVEMVVVTRGQRGGEVFLPKDKMISFTAPLVEKVVDPTGAGDAFALGFGLTLINGATVGQAIRAGKKTAGKILAKKGGLIFTYL